MTKRNKKLSLKKETVRRLSNRELTKANGGVEHTRAPAYCVGDGLLDFNIINLIKR